VNTRLRADCAAALMDMAAKGTMKDPPVLGAPQGTHSRLSDGRDVLVACSNDYLGLAQHPDVIDGAVTALRTWGAGSTGSRLVTGNTELHEAFETALADFVGAESALVFSSGYTANIGAVVSLSGPGSLLVSDALTHASLVDACRLSRARVVVTPHRDVAAVEAALAGRDDMGALRLRTVAVKNAPSAGFPDKAADGKADPSVVLDLDYWVLLPR